VRNRGEGSDKGKKYNCDRDIALTLGLPLYDMRLPNQAGGRGGDGSRRKDKESRTRVQEEKEKHVETATTHRCVTLKNCDRIKTQSSKKYKEGMDMWRWICVPRAEPKVEKRRCRRRKTLTGYEDRAGEQLDWEPVGSWSAWRGDLAYRSCGPHPRR